MTTAPGADGFVPPAVASGPADRGAAGSLRAATRNPTLPKRSAPRRSGSRGRDECCGAALARPRAEFPYGTSSVRCLPRLVFSYEHFGCFACPREKVVTERCTKIFRDEPGCRNNPRRLMRPEGVMARSPSLHDPTSQPPNARLPHSRQQPRMTRSVARNHTSGPG
jgi:hypothetical protein